MTTLLETLSLSKSFGGIVVADGIDFKLNAGTVMGLVGPNGAGKSSLINLICGSITPDRGDVRLNGQSVRGLKVHQRARAGIARTWQHIRLFPGLTVLDNLIVGAHDYPGESPFSIFGSDRRNAGLRDKAMVQLERVGMTKFAGALPGELSIGKQKLASLGRALMNEGVCLFLDEPVAGVEGAAYDTLKRLIREEAQAGRAVCIVEHNISFIEDLCDHCAFMFNGAIVSEGSIAELMSDRRLAELYFGKRQ
jgi:branched-chain amino acid transport system ATP-binding protein